jgi:carboxylesterase type B
MTIPPKIVNICLREALDFPEKDFHHTIAIGITQFPFVAVIDGVLIPESPLMAFKNNHFKKTSILIGTNLNEGSYFLPYWKEEYFPLAWFILKDNCFPSERIQFFRKLWVIPEKILNTINKLLTG